MLGAWEVLVILFVVLLLFGGKRFPELARNLGKGMKEFKKASQEIADEIEREPSPTSKKVTEAPSKSDHVKTES